MKEPEAVHECDVYMDDMGFYRAECALCEWKSGRCVSEGEAEMAAKTHETPDNESEDVS